MIAQAIKSLFPQSEFVVRNPDGDFEIEWIGASFDVTKEEIVAEAARLKAEFDAKLYQRKRQVEYPAIGDQLDALFHAGVFPSEMADLIAAVKAKYPKGG